MATNRRGRRTTPVQLRARDMDRADAVALLDAAYETGQLSPDEHRARVDSVAAAATLDELDRLVGDLQVTDEIVGRTRFTPPPDPQPAPTTSTASTPTASTPPKPAQRRRAALLAAAALVGGLLFVTLVGKTPDSGRNWAAAETSDRNALFTVAGFGQMLDDIQREFGNLVVDRITIYPDRAEIERPIEGKPGQDQSYGYRIIAGAGELTDQGTSSRSSDAIPNDLAALRQNLPRVIGLFAGADRTLRVENPTSAHVIVGASGPIVEMNLTNDEQGTRGYLSVGFDGVIHRIHRSDQ
ncbi:DUF1707 SHOCT-like domain-containing protein [Prescottella agglutinans]|uniref:DUF1707 domain-containing protein n=1 Tax=Prescottella agglutinans TaxID=1644129 RepID=A0ABT6MF82_9NOCA|nr:DUF1707 domain-containing protein [Prescottella agglutinans]MDH6282956.1 hypothetical protein [Prescottella agglutinans]